jgi:hypothetical protein
LVSAGVELARNNNEFSYYDDNSSSLLICPHAELSSQESLTEPARIQNDNNNKQTNKKTSKSIAVI